VDAGADSKTTTKMRKRKNNKNKNRKRRKIETHTCLMCPLRIVNPTGVHGKHVK
jgi:hypothetical protein